MSQKKFRLTFFNVESQKKIWVKFNIEFNQKVFQRRRDIADKDVRAPGNK